MSVIAVTVVRPREGKSTLLKERVRRVGSIYERLGAEVRLSRIIAGPLTECVAIQRRYPDFTTATGTFKALGDDSEFAQWQEERDADPAGDPVIVRDIIRDRDKIGCGEAEILGKCAVPVHKPQDRS